MEIESITDWLKKSENELAHIRYQLEERPSVKVYTFMDAQDECIRISDCGEEELFAVPCDEVPANDCAGTFLYPVALKIAKLRRWRLIERTYYLCSTDSEDYT